MWSLEKKCFDKYLHFQVMRWKVWYQCPYYEKMTLTIWKSASAGVKIKPFHHIYILGPTCILCRKIQILKSDPVSKSKAIIIWYKSEDTMIKMLYDWLYYKSIEINTDV